MTPPPDPAVPRPADPRISEPHPLNPASGGSASGGPAPGALTDFVDRQTLQEIQDAFASVTRLRATIVDHAGVPITQPTDLAQRTASDLVFEQLVDVVVGPTASGAIAPFMAPISVGGRQLGAIGVEPGSAETDPDRLKPLTQLAGALNLDDVQRAELTDSAELAFGANHGAAIQFLYLIANAIARLCYEQHQSRQRVQELSALYRVSRAVAGHENLDQVLRTAVASIRDTMQVKASVIRLLHDTPDGPELRREASVGLSDDYLRKGRLLINRSDMLTAAMRGDTIYIADMPTDPRVYYPDQAAEEGVVSMLCVGIFYEGRAIGSLQLFTERARTFDTYEVDLIIAIAQLLATAIEKKRLDAARSENRAIMRQLHLAADVQKRMLPRHTPQLTGYDLAARYVPSFELSGDFYDFIELDHTLGIAIGDVVGKGVAASLLMAGARASLRAFAQDLYNLDEVISRVNRNLVRDTNAGEFVTLWYGTLGQDTGRLTYVNAGHEPGLVARHGKLHRLEAGGMIAGVDADQEYEKGIWDFEPGDLFLLHTDGLEDAMNKQGHRLGRAPVEAVFLDCAARGTSAADTIHQLLEAVHDHAGSARKTDDITLVVVRAQ